MNAATTMSSLTIPGESTPVQITFPDPKAEARLRELLARGSGPITVRLAPADTADVEGHAFGVALRSVALRLRVDGNDTEGHAISVHFPTADDANRFRRSLLAAGLLAGTIVIGSAGAIAITSQPVPATLSTAAQTQVYERPAGHGMLQGADMSDVAAPAATAAAARSGIDPVTGKPARSGFQEQAESGVTLSGSQALVRPQGRGILEGADLGPAAPAAAAAATVTTTSQDSSRPAGTGPLEGADR